MKMILKKLKNLLVQPSNIQLLVFSAFAIFLRVEHEYFFPTYYSDEVVHIIASISFLEGNGMSIPMASPIDWSSSNYQLVINWPYGYNFLLVFFYNFLNDWHIASIAIQLLCFISICWSVYLLLETTLKSQWRFPMMIFLVLFSFNILPYYFLTPPDLLGITFFVTGISLSIKYFLKTKLHFSEIVIGATLLYLSFMTRYAYLPMLIIFPIAIFFYDLIRGKIPINHVKKISIFFCTILVGLAVHYFVINDGLFLLPKLSDITPQLLDEEIEKRTFYPENLKRFDVRALTAPFFDFYLLIGLSSKLNLGNLLEVCFTTAVVILIIVVCYKIIRRLNSRKITLIEVSLVLTFAICISFLMYLSLTTPAKTNLTSNYWTYVEELRYYVPAQLALLILWLIHISLSRNKLLLYSCLFLSIFAVFSFVGEKIALINRTEDYFLTGFYGSEKSAAALERQEDLKQIILKNTIEGKKPIFLSSNPNSSSIAAMFGAVDGKTILTEQKKPYASEKIIAIFELTNTPFYHDREKYLESVSKEKYANIEFIELNRD